MQATSSAVSWNHSFAISTRQAQPSDAQTYWLAVWTPLKAAKLFFTTLIS